MHEVQKKFLQKYQRDCRKNKIYLLRSSSKFRPFGNIPGNITGAISLFLNITGAVAPVAPVLNTPLIVRYKRPITALIFLPSLFSLIFLSKYKCMY